LSTSQVSSLPGTGCVGNTNNSNQTETKSLNNDCGSVADGRTLWLFMKRHIFFPEIYASFSLFLRKGAFQKKLHAGTTVTFCASFSCADKSFPKPSFQLPREQVHLLTGPTAAPFSLLPSEDSSRMWQEPGEKIFVSVSVLE